MLPVDLLNGRCKVRYCETMSIKAKSTLLASVIFTGSMIGFVHIDQIRNKERLKEGLLEDRRRLQEGVERREANRLELEEQQKLTTYFLEKRKKENDVAPIENGNQ